VDESDLRVRVAAFAFLDQLRRLSPELFDRRTLQRGFVFEGERVPLLAPSGIFKPRVCSVPLSITTVTAKEDGSRPYDDAIGTDGHLRYRTREAMRRRVPLIYFHGIVEGK